LQQHAIVTVDSSAKYSLPVGHAKQVSVVSLEQDDYFRMGYRAAGSISALRGWLVWGLCSRAGKARIAVAAST
jgi:hypothetical protein